LFLALAPGLGACANLKRFAPPGIVKYEDLAGDKAQNPEIAERVAARKEGRETAYPNLSKTPQKAPQAIAAETQASDIAELAALRDELNAAVAADREEAVAERAAPVLLPGTLGEAAPLEAAREALADAVAKDDDAARAERGLPRKKPKED
jgi:hypothetical protein